MLSSIYRGGVIYDAIDIIEIRIIIAIQMQTFEKWTRPLSKFIVETKTVTVFVRSLNSYKNWK